MNFKTTYFLFGILLLVLGTFLVTQLFGTRTLDKQAYILPSLRDLTKPVAAKDIDRVEIVRSRPKEEKLLFFRDAQGEWQLKDPATHADSSQVNRLIDQVMGARREEQADLTPNLSTFGLENPAEVVTLYQKGSDQGWKINVGNTSSGDNNALVYVTSSDSPKDPAAVRKLDLDTLFKSPNEYRSKVLLANSAFDPIQDVKLSAPKHELVDLEKKGENKWRFEKPAFGPADYEGETPPPGSTGPSKISGVRGLLQAVADLRVDGDGDFADNDAGDSVLAAKGLEKDKPAQMRIEIKKQPAAMGDEKPEPVVDALLIGKKVDDKSDKFYARLESERNIVKVSAKNVDALRALLENPSVLRNRDLADLESSHIDAFDIKHDDQEIKLRKTGDPAAWKLLGTDTQTADVAPIQSLLNALTGKRTVKDFPESGKSDATLGFDKPSAVVSLWLDGIQKEEKKRDDAGDEKSKDAKPAEKKDEKTEPKLKDEKPTVKLIFGKKDKDVVYVLRESADEKARLAVPVSMLDKVSEPRLTYLEKNLPSFGPSADVSKVVLVKGTETIEINRIKDDKSLVWKIEQPKSRAGQIADTVKIDRIVNDLRNLQADKLMAEKATDQELTRYGLKNPPLKVTITVTKADQKTEDYAFLFGAEADNKTDVYAKQGNRDLVFVLPKSLLDDFNADLQDPTVLHYDVSKLKEVKLTGWQDVVGAPLTLDVEHKSAQEWIVKHPADFKLDVPKLEAFLGTLTHLRAERFLGKGVKPEYKLDVKQGALEIALTIEGEKQPVELTLGAVTSNSVYARSNKLPDEVFLLPKALFEQARSKPANFKKE
jgi:hypothetical protein